MNLENFPSSFEA